RARAEERCRRQRNALIRLEQDAGREADDLTAALRRVIEADAHALDVARVSLWFFNADRTILQCADLYELPAGGHSSGMELKAGSYPVYFGTLAAVDTIVASDAQCDPRPRA